MTKRAYYTGGGGYDPDAGQGWPNAIRNRAKTHCPQGHPYDEANTAHRYGRRYCRTCAVLRERARRQRAKHAE